MPPLAGPEGRMTDPIFTYIPPERRSVDRRAVQRPVLGFFHRAFTAGLWVLLGLLIGLSMIVVLPAGPTL